MHLDDLEPIFCNNKAQAIFPVFLQLYTVGGLQQSLAARLRNLSGPKFSETHVLAMTGRRKCLRQEYIKCLTILKKKLKNYFDWEICKFIGWKIFLNIFTEENK